MMFSLGGGMESSKTNVFPKFARDLHKAFVPVGLETLEGFTPGGTELTGLSRDELVKNLRGDYLRPESNPYLEPMFDILGRRATQQFEQSNDVLRSQAQRGGGLYSTRANVAGQEQAGKINQQLQDSISQLLYGNYSQERGRQVGAINPSIGLDEQALQQATQIADLLKGTVSKSSGWNMKASGGYGAS